MIAINQSKNIKLTVDGGVVSGKALVNYDQHYQGSIYPVTEVLILSEATTTLLDIDSGQRVKVLREIIVLNDLSETTGRLYLDDSQGGYFDLWTGILAEMARTYIYGLPQNYPNYLVDLSGLE